VTQPVAPSMIERYECLTKLSWQDHDYLDREQLWSWMRANFGQHGDRWCNRQSATDSRVIIVTFNVEDAAVVSLMWS
jgi:hypothetical protein